MLTTNINDPSSNRGRIWVKEKVFLGRGQNFLKTSLQIFENCMRGRGQIIFFKKCNFRWGRVAFKENLYLGEGIP